MKTAEIPLFSLTGNLFFGKFAGDLLGHSAAESAARFPFSQVQTRGRGESGLDDTEVVPPSAENVRSSIRVDCVELEFLFMGRIVC